MIMRKIISLTIIAMFICIGLSNIAGADEFEGVTLDGSVKVTISDYIGLVSPSMVFTEEQLNQSVEFFVDVIEDGENTTYMVNDTLRINLDVVNESGRSSFIIPRSLYSSIWLQRESSKPKLLPLRGFLNRLFPVKVIYDVRIIVDYMLGKNLFGKMYGNKTDNITIPVNYEILSQEDFENGESFNLHIFSWGSIPGDAGEGAIEKLPVVAYTKIHLDVTYVETSK